MMTYPSDEQRAEHFSDLGAKEAAKELGYDGFFSLDMTTFTVYQKDVQHLLDAGKLRIISGSSTFKDGIQIICKWVTKAGE